MKKFLAVSMVLLCVTLAMASGFYFVSLDAATATGAGGALPLAQETASGFTWTVTSTGTPTSIVTNLEGSLDNVTYFTLDSSTATSEMRHVVNKDVRYLRCNLATLSGGTSPKVTCSIFKGSR